MSLIENIRINGQQYSSTGIAPTVAGLNPVIGWDFSEDIAAFAQSAFHIQIGESPVSLGTSSFDADILNVYSVSSSNFYEYLKHDLQRGNTYYGQIKAIDPDNDETPWAIFTFTVNHLPFITNFYLSPTSPTASDNVELVYTYNDINGHEEAGTKIRWFRNNIAMHDYDDLCILPSSALSPGESWSAQIVPSDGLEYGPVVETSSITILGSQSSFSSIIILPTDANVDDILKVEWELNESDEYISTIGTISIEWYINGVLVQDSNNQYMRLDLDPGDIVNVILILSSSDGTILSTGASRNRVIEDVDWHLFNLSVNELRDSIVITDVTPIVEWLAHKTTSEHGDTPNYFRLLVTKTPSMDGPIYDTGEVEYVKNSFVIPENVLSRGQDYYIHVGISDFTDIHEEGFSKKLISIVGSSWEENVSNSTGWTIETKLQLIDGEIEPNPVDPKTGEKPENVSPRVGIYVHDGTYFCAITFEQDQVTFHSDTNVTKSIPSGKTDLRDPKTFRISGKGQDVKIFIDNILLIDATGLLTNPSRLKFIEYGDIDGKYINKAIFKFVRYSTLGALGLGTSFPYENTFYFSKIGTITGGTIEHVQSNLISWLPDDEEESAKLISFNENPSEARLPTVTKNYSPITCIFVDKNRNKYIGTANGVNAIYGEFHDPDYQFLTTSTDVVITTEDFDRITTVAPNNIYLVEPDIKTGWFTIDTTFRTIGVEDQADQFTTGDPYDPYKPSITSHAIHYYSQRTHGHSWYDRVDNSKGWQITFSFQLDRLEQDSYIDQNIDHQGFGVYINDGTYQEILYFYEDRIRLYYANVFVPIVTTSARSYRIVGKDNSLYIYQKLDNPSISSYQLLVNGAGLFTTPASPSGNGHKPKVIFDSSGLYHCVWNDDGNGRSQIFYSSYNGESWSNPEIIASSKFGLRNPSIAVDSANRVWVAYEDTSWGMTEISVSVKDNAGWNLPTRITNYKSNKNNPDIIIDAFENVHLVWEDDRNGPSQIFWAKRNKNTEAWISSAQFGEDTPIMQQNDNNDPYLSGAVSCKSPKLAFNHPYIWMASVVTEANGYSSIYTSIYNSEEETWNSMGVPQFDSDGDFTSYGVSTKISPNSRHCINPTIAMNDSKGVMVIAWEDTTEPISQIWGSSFNSFGTELVSATQITSRSNHCKNPSVGFMNNQCAILFESDGQIFLANYDSNFRTFNGSATGDSDELIQVIDNRDAFYPSISPFVPSTNSKIVYEFLRVQDNTLEAIEFPDYYLIGDASVSHAELSYPQDIVETSTTSSGTISNIDTKEFAFGDMSENTSILAHWKDIQIYYGYDARPYSISKFNNSTVFGWGDNRINDIFVDTFGNLIVAKYDKLVYHNVFTGELTDIILEANQTSIVTSVAWGGNGAWYVGTSKGLYLSTSAGKTWTKYTGQGIENAIVNDIAIDPEGKAVCGTNIGIIIASSDKSVELITIADKIQSTQNINNIRAVAVDENNVIWAGGDAGLIRIENKINFLLFNKKSGMRSSYVTDIAIVNKYLRYVSTANGIDKMHGTTFSSINTQTHAILNNNISKIYWIDSTQSLWVASLDSLYEIVFRDSAHDIIQDEVVRYRTILTETSFDTTSYIVLDLEEIQDSGLEIVPESVDVLINHNKTEFGFSVGEFGKSVSFLTPLLTRDEVEIFVSNKFIEFHNFNQTNIEKQTYGDKRVGIPKIVKTITKNQTLFLSNIDKHQILLLSNDHSLPYTTILLDRELPLGCFKQIDTLTPTTLKFKIIAYDKLAGIDGYMLSNYSNFTSDGETPLEFSTLPMDGVVVHNIGSELNNVITTLEFPNTEEVLDGSTVNVGAGSVLGKWTDTSTNVTYLYAFTNFPPLAWRFDPTTEEWTALGLLSSDSGREVTDAKEFNNVLYVATGSNTPGAAILYKTTDGLNFEIAVSSATNTHFNGIAIASDGIVYVGDNGGNIYRYKNNVSERIATNIGDEIHYLDVWKNLLVVGTGNKGRVYLVDLENGNDLIIYIGDELDINHVHIKDSETSTVDLSTNLYISSNESSSIYRSNMRDFSFMKSFGSSNKSINRIRSIDKNILQDTTNNDPQLSFAIASIGDGLYKHVEPNWEFLYLHSDEINDFIQYGVGNSEGIYVISDDKITRWSKTLEEKTVYLKIRDKAGNESEAPDTETACPETNEEDTYCCGRAYSLKISDLKDFINESRIVNIDEYGSVQFTYNSPNDRVFYSADEIDEEIGTYTSEIINGSNDLVSWKTISWIATEPEGTSVNLQIRSSTTESGIDTAEWTDNLIKNSEEKVSISHITDQYLQFRAILRSTTRGITPTLTSVTIRNITTQASHFFTTNFILPSRPVKGILTANTFIPVSADVVFGINTKDSTDFGDYQIIEPNRLFTTTQGQFGENLRIGIKLLSPGIPQVLPTADPNDPYNQNAFECNIAFTYENSGVSSNNFHFKVEFYNDSFRTQLIHTFYSGSDQTGWSYGSGDNTFPADGVTIASSDNQIITFTPGDRIETNQRWYIAVEVWDGSSFETVINDRTFVCSECNITNELNLVSTYYKSGLPTLDAIPQFSDFTPDYSLLEHNLNFGENFGEWVNTKNITLSGYTDNFAARFQGKIQAPIEGLYTFELESSDGSILFINGEEIINHDGTHGLTTATGTVTLTEGFHDIEVHYFEATGGSGLSLKWILPGESSAVVVPRQRFFHAVSNEYCADTNSPKVFNFAILFELENGETVKINLT